MKRRTLLMAAGGVVTSGLLLPGTARAATVAIDPAARWGTWDGWGTSLAWWANVFGARDDLADTFFTTKNVTVGGQTLPGLGLNIARYNLGACSWNTYNGEAMVASPNIPRFKQIECYWQDWASADPASTSWKWSADATQRAMMTKAYQRGAIVELFSNSPPWWMCINHNPSGAANGADNNLQSWNYQQFAAYLAEVARYSATQWGLPFASVEAFNESTSNYWSATGKQEGCHFDPAVQEQVISYLRTELNNRGLSSTPIAASDETSYTAAINTWRSYASATKNAVGRINVHGYEGSGGRRDLLLAEAQSAGKKLWNSEYGDSDSSGMSMVKNLSLDMHWLHPTAWVYWQVIDESSAWALIPFNSSNNTLGSVQTKYFLLAQYTRHIRPGMQVIDTGSDTLVAAYDAAAHRLVVVAVNTATSAQSITIDLSKFTTVPADGTVVRRWATSTTGSGDRYTAHTDDRVSGKAVTRSLEAGWVHTFEIDGVAP